MSRLFNIARNALRPGYARVMAGKVVARFRERAPDPAAVAAWCAGRAIPLAPWAERVDAALWQEAEAFAEAQRNDPRIQGQVNGLGLGSGGAYNLLYFLTRLLKPAVIVETGVAAGFSSRAFLSAMKANDAGHLYSSDFPLFRLENPADHVGYVVEPGLRARWTLDIRGDRVAVPEFAAAVDRVDLFHYDSDKSAAGRAFALDAVSARLSPEALIMFDDIQDNWHFRDFAAQRRTLVFEFQGKWVGMTGGPDRLYTAPEAERPAKYAAR